MACQLLQENGVGDSVEGFAELSIDYIHNLSSVTCIMKGDQVGQAEPAFPKPMLAGPDALVVLHMPCDGTQANLFYNLPQH